MPRFVVLLHETPPGYPRGTHFDLMLEQDGMLRTWALDALPLAGQSVLAEQLRDHRPEYLDYQGEVAAGRGRVNRIDAGDFDVTTDTADRLAIALRGSTLAGMLTLARTAENPHLWRVSLAAGEASSSAG